MKLTVACSKPGTPWLLATFIMFSVALFARCSPPPERYAPTPAPKQIIPAPIVTKAPEPALPREEKDPGRTIFIGKACTACHMLQGVPEAQGKVGPDLSRQASRDSIAGVLPNNEENLKRFLKEPGKVKPGALMPNQNLTDSEIDALVAFLRSPR